MSPTHRTCQALPVALACAVAWKLSPGHKLGQLMACFVCFPSLRNRVSLPIRCLQNHRLIYLFLGFNSISDPCYYSILCGSKSLTEPKLWKSCGNNFRYFPANENIKNKLFNCGQEAGWRGFHWHPRRKHHRINWGAERNIKYRKFLVSCVSGRFKGRPQWFWWECGTFPSSIDLWP